LFVYVVVKAMLDSGALVDERLLFVARQTLRRIRVRDEGLFQPQSSSLL